MSNATITIDRVKAGMQGILKHGNKPRTDAQILTVAANRLNRALVERGEKVGYRPCVDWSGLESWTIELDDDGKPLAFKIVQAASPARREVDSFLDSLGDVLDTDDDDGDADTDTE